MNQILTIVCSVSVLTSISEIGPIQGQPDVLVATPEHQCPSKGWRGLGEAK